MTEEYVTYHVEKFSDEDGWEVVAGSSELQFCRDILKEQQKREPGTYRLARHTTTIEAVQ